MEFDADEREPRKLIGRASIVAAGTLYQQAVSLASGLVVARVLGAGDYGIFNLARSLVDVTGIVTRLGLDVGLQRYLGETNDRSRRAARVALLRRVRLLAGGLATVPALAVALGLGVVLEQHVYRHPGFANVLACLLLVLPFMTDIAVLGGAYRGVLKLAPTVLAEYVLLPTVRLAAIIVLFLAGWRLSAVVAGTMLASVAACVYLASRARADFRVAGRGSDGSWADALRVVGYSSVLSAAVLVTTLTGNMDLLLLGHFATAQDVGQYSLVKTLLLLMGIFGAAFAQGLGALVAERHAQGDHRGMVGVMSLTARWIMLGTLPIFAVFLFWGAQLTTLFGASFRTSEAVVGWLAASQLLIAVLGPAGWALSMTGRHFLELRILCVGLLVATVLGWLAIPSFGQSGAAAGTFTAVLFANGLRLLYVRRAIGRFPFDGDIVRIAVLGTAFAWLSRAAVAQLGLPEISGTACGIGLFLLVYGLIGWTQWLDGRERQEIRLALFATGRRLSGRTI